MPDDQVMIDPEFSPPPPGDGQSRWLRVAGIVAVGVAAFIMGWLLRSPAPGEPDSTEAAVTSTTALTGETTTSTTRSRPSTTTTTVAEEIELAVPLGEAVPGFTETITMAVWSETTGLRLMRWPSSQSAPETIVSFSDDEPPWFGGLDASGTWYTFQDENGTLSVRSVLDVVDDPVPWGWGPPAFPAAVRIWVAESAWHDTEPGRLAWLNCPRTSGILASAAGGSGTLYTLDVTDSAAEPVPVALTAGVCGENTGLHLGGWGEWGFVLRKWDAEGHESEVLLDTDGTEVATLGDDVGFAPGPGGVIWTEEASRPGATSYLVTTDGQTREPVPGLADDEWVDGALWSPDGSHLALSPRKAVSDIPVIRIVEVATGTIVGEISQPGRYVWPMAWSSDGRLLFFRRVSYDREREPPFDWLVYDTATGVATELPIPERHDLWEIRTSEPIPIAEQFTPVEWDIALDEESWGPGVYTVFMTVDVRPLLPDQVEYVSGRLMWDETVVDLCNIGMDDVGDGFLHVGDAFQTVEGCGANPTAMQDAFDEFGIPETACVAVRVAGVDHEYCAPLD